MVPTREALDRGWASMVCSSIGSSSAVANLEFALLRWVSSADWLAWSRSSYVSLHLALSSFLVFARLTFSLSCSATSVYAVGVCSSLTILLKPSSFLRLVQGLHCAVKCLWAGGSWCTWNPGATATKQGLLGLVPDCCSGSSCCVSPTPVASCIRPMLRSARRTVHGGGANALLAVATKACCPIQ